MRFSLINGAAVLEILRTIDRHRDATRGTLNLHDTLMVSSFSGKTTVDVARRTEKHLLRTLDLDDRNTLMRQPFFEIRKATKIQQEQEDDGMFHVRSSQLSEDEVTLPVQKRPLNLSLI